MKRTPREKAQAHATHAYFCSCGYVIHGNGAKAAHRGKHLRANDGHSWWTRAAWEEHGRPQLNHPDPERRRPILKETP